jgi:hypothetical protein
LGGKAFFIGRHLLDEADFLIGTLAELDIINAHNLAEDVSYLWEE